MKTFLACLPPLIVAWGTVAAADPVPRVFPAEIVLPDAAASVRVSVRLETADGLDRDLTGEVGWDEPAGLLERDAAGLVTAAKAGTGTLTLTWKTHVLRVPITTGKPVEPIRKVSAGTEPERFEPVRGGRSNRIEAKFDDEADAEPGSNKPGGGRRDVSDRLSLPKEIRFVRDILPRLSKAGCNQGVCHGSQEGKGGLKFSLRGYDGAYDHEALVEDLAGRRVDPVEPHRSLVLRKISGGLPHGGGELFDPATLEYRLLAEWLRQGALPEPKPVAVVRLEIVPPRLRFGGPGETFRAVAVAHYADGSRRDVTHLAFCDSSLPEVVEADDFCELKSARPGRTAVVFRYEGCFTAVPVLVLGTRSPATLVPRPVLNRIDALVDDDLRARRVQAAELCTDADFLRRAALDLTGLPPLPAQVQAFQADARPTAVKRAAAVDALLASPEFIEHWTNRWCTLLQSHRRSLGADGIWTFRRLVRQAVAEDRPYDEFVRDVLAGSGGLDRTTAAAYYRIHPDAESAVEATTHLFLGIRFNCNRCHDHPFERWTQAQYYELAAFFAQTGRKPLGAAPLDDGKSNLRPGPLLVYDADDGEQNHPLTRRPVAPRFPMGAEDPAFADLPRRERLARWLTSPAHPYFVRSYVNRLWAHLLGTGLIEPVDDLRAGNPPTHPALLDHLAEEFVRGGMRLRPLLRHIALSRTYQLAGTLNPSNSDDLGGFSRAIPRRLPAEVLLDSLHRGLEVPLSFPDLPAGLRANQLPDSEVPVKGDFLGLFGRPVRESPCECERTDELQLAQALALINGPSTADALASPKARPARLAREQPDDAAAVDELFLALWCRLPTAEERRLGLAAVRAAETRPAGLQDLAWALINSPAFLFNR